MNLLWSLPVLVLGLFLFLKAFLVFCRPWTSPLRVLPGPKSPSFFYGHYLEIFNAENSTLQEAWVLKYGRTFKYYGFGNIPRLFTMDTRALNYVLTHSEDYHKPEATRTNLERVLGAGLLVVEGAKHRQQNPAFGPAQVRSLIPIFNQKSIELRDVWLSQLASEDPQRIDVLSWLSRATLDIIGLAGFGYTFDALAGSNNELHKAFQSSLRASRNTLPILLLLRARIHLFRLIRTHHDNQIEKANAVINRIGSQLIQDRKTAILDADKTTDSAKGKDLLSLLVKANMEDKEGMSDDDVLAQVPTFLVAGHDTTSTATTWALYSLSLNPEVQSKLREELFTITSGTPSMDAIKSLGYLDVVVKETLRLHSPVPSTVRVAMKNDMIPLEDGGAVRVGKGDLISIPILAMNRAKYIWGEDSFEFKPERWNSLPEKVTSIPGVWGNILSFLGGSRACIGYQFSIFEMKCLLFTLVRSFEFSLAVPKESIMKKSSIIQKPTVKGEEDKGPQMPLFVKVYSHG